MPANASSKVRVAFVQRHPDSGHGGEERSLFNIMRARAAAGEKDVLIYKNRGDFAESLENHGVYLIQALVGEFEARNLFSAFLSAIKCGFALKKAGVHVLHVNHYKDIAWCAVVARIAGATLTLHLRLNAPEYLSRQYRLGIKRTRRFAANSAFVKKDWQKYLPGNAIVDVIWNGLPLDSWPVKSSTPKNAGAPLIIGFIGRIVYEKGFHLLVEALREFDHEWQVLIAGSDKHSVARGESSYLQNIRQQIAAMGWENRFTFLGHVNTPEQFFQQIDVLVTPSYHDSFGRTFMEGVCAGVPVLTSAAGAMTEVAEKLPLQKLLLFEEGNATGLRAALEAFVNRNDFDVETYARQGRALFDLRRTIEETDTFFRRAKEFS